MSFKSLVTFTSVALSLVACGGAPASESTRTSAGQAATVAPEFAGCALDSDCVAVPQAGCCSNGWLAAVNGALVSQYQAANTCTEQVVCPMYVVKDVRAARCDDKASACAMMVPTEITCSADSPETRCPQGFHCGQPDGASLPGKCAKDDGATAF